MIEDEDRASYAHYTPAGNAVAAVRVARAPEKPRPVGWPAALCVGGEYALAMLSGTLWAMGDGSGAWAFLTGATLALGAFAHALVAVGVLR